MSRQVTYMQETGVLKGLWRLTCSWPSRDAFQNVLPRRKKFCIIALIKSISEVLYKSLTHLFQVTPAKLPITSLHHVLCLSCLFYIVRIAILLLLLSIYYLFVTWHVLLKSIFSFNCGKDVFNFDQLPNPWCYSYLSMLCHAFFSPFPFWHFEVFVTRLSWDSRFHIYMLKLVQCANYTSSSSVIVVLPFTTLFLPKSFCPIDIFLLNYL